MMHPDLPYERNRVFLKRFRFSLLAHQHVCVLSVPLSGHEGEDGAGGYLVYFFHSILLFVPGLKKERRKGGKESGETREEGAEDRQGC